VTESVAKAECTCAECFATLCVSVNILLLYSYSYYILQTHKKSLRIQQHPASAFTAAIKNATWAGQAQAGKTPQANTTKHYSTHSSVGTRMPARKLAPLDLTNMPTDAQYAKKSPLHRPTLSSRNAPFTNEAHVTPPGPAASSPSTCKSFIAGWPRRPYVSTEKDTKP
jgi:hypothetical protein